MVVYNEINIKLIILGSGAVGKTSLVHSFFHEKIPTNYYPTIGSLINKKQYKFEEYGFIINLNVWDIGGQKSFNPLNPVFYQNTDVALLVFDTSNPKDSLKKITSIYLKNLLQKSEDCIFFLIGNKIDLEYEEEYIKKEVRKNSLSKVPLSLVSAKTGQKVEEIFQFITYSYLKENEKNFEEKGIENLSKYFLKYIKKDEEDLKHALNNLDNIGSIKIQKQKSLDIKQIKIKQEREEIEDLNPILKSLGNFDDLREQIIGSYRKNISFVKDMIEGLGNTPINLLLDTIEETKIHLDGLKQDFEQKLEVMLNIDNLVTNKVIKENNNTQKEWAME